MKKGPKHLLDAKDLLRAVPRHAALCLLEMVDTFGTNIAYRRYSEIFSAPFPNRFAYHTAVSRLRKAGLLVNRSPRKRTPVLQMTDEGRKRISPSLHPNSFWNRKWEGAWFVISYDVPEKDRAYRDVLRRFLASQRMGCLQKSLWICPDDIRSSFRDMMTGARAQDFAVLFSCWDVLGLSKSDIVFQAWPFLRIISAQESFCSKWKRRLHEWETSLPTGNAVDLAKEELEDYIAAMHGDPLLPKKLWPPGYAGKEAYELHKTVVRTISKRL